MEICRKITDGKHYICLEEHQSQITLITPSGQTKSLIRNAFDDPFEIDTSSETNLKLEISQFELTIDQVTTYSDYLLHIMGSMLDFEESGPASLEKKREENDASEVSLEESIIYCEKIIPIIKNLLQRNRQAFLRRRRRRGL